MAHRAYTNSRVVSVSIVVTGGAGSISLKENGFAVAQIGLCYCRSINPPGGSTTATYTAFVTNSKGKSHDYVSGTGPTQFNDPMTWHDEVTYNISGASLDGTWTVDLWLI